MTLYEILGVPEDAKPEEIRAAHRAKAKLYHPDRNKDPKALEMMKAVNEAYEVLSDSTKRAKYDAFLHRPAAHMGMPVIIIQVEDIFAGGFSGPTSSATTSGFGWTFNTF